MESRHSHNEGSQCAKHITTHLSSDTGRAPLHRLHHLHRLHRPPNARRQDCRPTLHRSHPSGHLVPLNALHAPLHAPYTQPPARSRVFQHLQHLQHLVAPHLRRLPTRPDSAASTSPFRMSCTPSLATSGLSTRGRGGAGVSPSPQPLPSTKRQVCILVPPLLGR